ncbi:AMP-binding protein [Nitrospira sp. MA-1]|nr:AMP-binding protein [Nitrospira sp. MA-1]
MPCPTIGYLDDPTAFWELLHDGWLHTGDLGYIEEQSYVWFVGRKKLIIVRRGIQYCSNGGRESDR